MANKPRTLSDVRKLAKRLGASRLDQLTPPQRVFIGSNAKRLYALEEKRSAAIKACAEEWAKLFDVPEDRYWQVSLPQALFDILENYEVAVSTIAAEQFLKQLGWNVTRPTKTNGPGD
jgi:hypothetical protein